MLHAHLVVRVHIERNWFNNLSERETLRGGGNKIVKKQYCREVLERLRKRVHRVRPENADTWMLHHDNAPCHTAISVNEFLAKKRISVVPQSPHSPDLSLCDFFLFPKLKFHLKGRHFGTVDNIQKVVTD